MPDNQHPAFDGHEGTSIPTICVVLARAVLNLKETDEHRLEAGEVLASFVLKLSEQEVAD